MKTTLFAFCFLCASAAFGQSSSGSAALTSQVQFPEHAQHATQQPLAQEQSLLGSSGYFYAQGERPLWEVQPLSHEIPLGDLARELRKEHATTKKADFVRND